MSEMTHCNHSLKVMVIVVSAATSPFPALWCIAIPPRRLWKAGNIPWSCLEVKAWCCSSFSQDCIEKLDNCLAITWFNARQLIEKSSCSGTISTSQISLACSVKRACFPPNRSGNHDLGYFKRFVVSIPVVQRQYYSSASHQWHRNQKHRITNNELQFEQQRQANHKLSQAVFLNCI